MAKSNKVSLSIAEMRVMVELAESMPASVAAAKEAITQSIGIIVEAKNASDSAKTAKESGVWGSIRTAALDIAELTASTPAIRSMAFEAAFGEYFGAAKDTPEATVKAYFSTASNMLEKLYDAKGKEGLNDLKYREVRSLLNPADDAEMVQRIESITKMLNTIKVKGFKGKRGAEAIAATRAGVEELEELATTLYNAVKGEYDANRVADTAARELADIAAKQPTTATAVESKVA